jgi:hypothetical protein
MIKRSMYLRLAAVGFAATISASLVGGSGQVTTQRIAIDNDDIGGIVTGPRGPEAGVWVIAETSELPTLFRKIVVSDDQGRYVLPDLPKANYDVWVRGYGLVDSVKIKAAPGRPLDLMAVAPPSPRAAAEYYPAQYWLALLQVPPKSDFPGTGLKGNGISENVRSQGDWIRQVVSTDGCTGCHQLGSKATREIPKNLGPFDNSVAAWGRRIRSGQVGGWMSTKVTQAGRSRVLAMYADWTDRISAGELPAVAPARPQGLERNVVITIWDWADPKVYLHDEIATDKRNPTVNANGPLYGALEFSGDYMPVLNPVRNTATRVRLIVRDPKTTPSEASTASTRPVAPSPYWGDEVIWSSQTVAHSFAMDRQGRVWIAARIRPPQTPGFCQEGSNHPSAQAFPIKESDRQMQMYDPKTNQITTLDTCFDTQHLNFAEHGNDTIWFSGGPGGQPVVGWFNTKMYDQTEDEQKSQGWTTLVLDTNGNGKRDAYVEPDQPIEPTKDRRISASLYGISPSPVDDSIWGSVQGRMPGFLVRLVPGSNPPVTALAEIYEVPWNNPKAPAQGFGPRGMDVDSNDVVWTVLSSGHLASFDRRKCKGPLNGPTATGQHCPEGWSLYPLPGPNYKGAVDSASADSAYYDFVDRFDMLGLGRNVPIATGNGSGSLLAWVDGQFVTLRVPYPLGFHAKGLDGRIDDPKAGWKGKGIWTTIGSRAPFHMEGGKGTTAKVFKFQVRPDPLAR